MAIGCYPFLFRRYRPPAVPSLKGSTMGARRIRREQRRVDMAQSRLVNGVRKVKERARRQSRLRKIVSKGKLPYTPVIMSWLSAELDKPSRLLTQAEVDAWAKG
jgi:hypothetical protein